MRKFVAALQANDREGANALAQEAIATKARLRDKWRAVFRVLQANGELSDADRACALFVEQSTNRDMAQFERATLAAQCGRAHDAWDLLADIPSSAPNPASNAFLKGTIAMNLGRIDEAEEHLTAAIEANPQLGQPYLALAKCRKRGADDPLGDTILQGSAALANAHPMDRAQYNFAAGSVHFDRRSIDPAFARFAEGASLMAAQAPYDPAADAREAEAGRAGFDRDSIARIAETVQTDTSEAIFVTGLPRSGTTLVEQILASHSAVVGGEELGRMAVVQRDLPANSLAGLQAYLADRPADDLTQLYLHLGRERFGDGGRYVDKGLNNPRYMGLIASLMPQSPVIWLRRDPLDCAWSAFRTFFASGVDWSWQQTAIAQHFAIEDALFAFWSELLPDRILPVEYADLVRDPRSQIERILQFCNLPVEPAVFEPHRTERVVSTASVMQVREPIGTDALGSAHPYSDYLRPFSDAYAAASAR